MPLKYLGHSAIEIVTAQNKVILIDPWLKGNPSCPPSLHNPEKVDLIVLSHGHSDHTDGVVELAIRTKARVCAIWELAHLLIADGLPAQQIIAMNKGGSFIEQGLEIALTDAKHSSSYTDKKGLVHYAGEPCGIILRLESGRVIYHAGDTCLFSDMKLIAELYKPEIALLPIGGRFTMNVDEAIFATKWLCPKVVIPIHYNTFDEIKADTNAFVQNVSSFAKVILLEPGESYRSSK